MTPPKKIKTVKAWALMASGVNTYQGFFISRGEARLAQDERIDIYKTFIIPVLISPITSKKRKK